METRSLRNVVYLSAGIGIIVSLFAAFEVIDASLEKICSFNGFISCATVANSGHTTFLYVPDWLWGIAGFVAIIVVAAVAERHPSDPRYAAGLVGLTTAGVALSLYLLYIELGVIGALCIVCATAYAMGFIAWGGAIALIRVRPRAGLPEEPD